MKDTRKSKRRKKKIGKYIACIVQELSAEEAIRREVSVPPDADGQVRIREEYDVTAPLNLDPREVGDSVADSMLMPGDVYCEWCVQAEERTS